MELKEADRLLEGAELIPAIKTTLPHAKELLEQCLAAEIPAILGRDEGCASGSCGPQVQILIKAEDVRRLSSLLERQWTELAEREGMGAPLQQGPLAEGEEPPCPACGTAAALVNGACSDCGLQLE